MNKPLTKVGIDDMALYVPALYLPIDTLATVRGIEPAKLQKGLGLKAMAMPNANEDAATMAANAALDLILKNQLDPRRIGRLYVGTESALDGAKPIASYVVEMLTQYFQETYGADCLLQCDVVDLTFACIGAVDALQNTMDWASGATDRLGIVIATDFAKYELGSGGEYTQGAGAVALLIKQHPRLLAFGNDWGTATVSVHDFFKPIRELKRSAVLAEAAQLLKHDAEIEVTTAPVKTSPAQGVFDHTDEWVKIHRDTPIFDGQYSNQCYQQRIRQAYHNFISQALGYANGHPGPVFSGRWDRLVFHLPYAYHARRVFVEIYLEEAIKAGRKAQIEQEVGAPVPENDRENYLKLVSKTPSYQAFVNHYIEKGERLSSLVGNIYTGSIFLALMSVLEADYQEDAMLEGKKLGFFAYGSGSKSKVFEAEVQAEWRAIVERFGLMDSLENRQEIDYETYEKLHRGAYIALMRSAKGVFTLEKISNDPLLPGVRSYQMQETLALSPR